MKPKTATHHRRWVLRLFEWAVLICVIQLLAGIFLQRVDRLLADAEHLAFQGVVNSLKAAATFASIGRRSFREGDNPMQLLDQMPANYAGELRNPGPETLTEGHWYFDKAKDLLIYCPRTYRRTVSELGEGQNKKFRLESEKFAGQIRYQLVFVSD